MSTNHASAIKLLGHERNWALSCRIMLEGFVSVLLCKGEQQQQRSEQVQTGDVI